MLTATPKLLTALLVIAIAFFSSCYSVNKQEPSLKQYDLDHPKIMSLPSSLNEISGIVYYPKDTSIFAISDASGFLYKIYLRTQQIKRWKFGSNHDYEDLQLLDSTFYILSSNGTIVTLRFDASNNMQTKQYSFTGKGKNEFESLYYDDEQKKLMLLCKDCKEDARSISGVWSFDPVTTTFTKESFSVDISNVSKNEVEKRKKFHPSAAAIHPVTHQLFILSSVNKALVIADKNGNVQEAYPLNPGLYKQPEGIAFTPTGDMIISNESAGEGNANLLLLKFKR